MRTRNFLFALSPMLFVPLWASSQTVVSAPTPPAALAASALTPVPPLVPYEGVALDAQGKPVAGPASLTFLFYKDAEGGEPLFTETQTVALDATGRYKVQLGASLPSGLPADLFGSGEARWLAVQIAGQAPQPRLLLMSVPYALKASDAATLGGLPASAFALAGRNTAASGTITGTITGVIAGTALTGGGTSGNVTLNLDTTKVPLLGSANLFAGNQSVAGSLTSNDNSAATNAAGLTGNETAATGQVFGVSGTAASSTTYAAGVSGDEKSNAGLVFGVRGNTNSVGDGASGVAGYEGAATGQVFGVSGKATSSGTYAAGINGIETATTGVVYGVSGNTASTGTNAAGVSGYEGATTGIVHGVSGGTASSTPGATGVSGYEAAATGEVYGVNGAAVSTTTNAAGVSGYESAATGQVYGTMGTTFSAGNYAAGVSGYEGATTGVVYGVIGGTSSSTTGASGVNGGAYAATGVVYGVNGTTASATNGASGVFGSENAANGAVFGVSGGTNSTTDGAAGVNGGDYGGTGVVYGVSGGTNSITNGAAAVNGYEGAATGVVYGVQGQAVSNNGAGVQGLSPHVGVAAINQTCGASGCTYVPGVAGQFTTGAGGLVLQGFAGSPKEVTQVFNVDSRGNGYFLGNLNVTGNVSKGGGSFKIDDPLDPANKYLSHSFVESPDMMDVYNGNIVTDKRGVATVVLPEYFEALNRDFRYQLTVVGKFAQAIVLKKVDKNHFVIRTSKPGVEVSWQVTGIRQDAYANANRIPVEEVKPAAEQGYYLHPEVFGQPADKSLAAAKPLAPHVTGTK
jgi:hypothetical protein